MLGGDYPLANKQAVPGPSKATPIDVEAFILFLASFATYMAGAVYMVFGLHAHISDALIRTANAYFVLFSRDPHLSAIGFV